MKFLVPKVFLLFCLLSIVSCSIFDTESPVPAYILVDNAIVKTIAGEGDPQSKIEEVWVFADGIQLGVFPLPAKIPYIIKSANEVEFTFTAGVKDSGIKGISVEYPFFQPIRKKIKPQEGQSYSQGTLTFSYKNEAVFDFVEDFESGHILSKDQDGNPNSFLTTTGLDKASGNQSGLLLVNDVNDINEVSNSFDYLRSANKGGQVFLEFDYKSDQPLFVGTVINTNGVEEEVYKVAFKPSDKWNRAYIDFTEEISNTEIFSYRIAFAVSYELKEKNEGKAFLDNVKLIHF